MIVQLAAAVALLFFGRDVCIPIAIAFVFATVLRPVIRQLGRWRIPAFVASAGVILSFLLILWGIGYALTPAAEKFVSQLPTLATTASTKLKALPRPLDRLGTMLSSGAAAIQRSSTDSTRKMTGDSVPPSSDSAKAPASPVSPAKGSGSMESAGRTALPILTSVFGTAAGVASAFVEILLLLLFFLAVGGDVHARLVKRARSSTLARMLVEVSDEFESVISRYLSLLALINLAQGTLIAIAMALIGMPLPPVWGAMAFVAEFFPYLGGATMVVLLTIVGLASGSGSHVLLAPAIYLVVTTLQNSVVSPVTYGRSLKLNPAAILVSVMVWWLLWGVLGAFLAVPILAIVKIVCSRSGTSLGTLGAIIGD